MLNFYFQNTKLTSAALTSVFLSAIAFADGAPSQEQETVLVPASASWPVAKLPAGSVIRLKLGAPINVPGGATKHVLYFPAYDRIPYAPYELPENTSCELKFDVLPYTEQIVPDQELSIDSVSVVGNNLSTLAFKFNKEKQRDKNYGIVINAMDCSKGENLQRIRYGKLERIQGKYLFIPNMSELNCVVDVLMHVPVGKSNAKPNCSIATQ